MIPILAILAIIFLVRAPHSQAAGILGAFAQAFVGTLAIIVGIVIIFIVAAVTDIMSPGPCGS